MNDVYIWDPIKQGLSCNPASMAIRSRTEEYDLFVFLNKGLHKHHLTDQDISNKLTPLDRHQHLDHSEYY